MAETLRLRIKCPSYYSDFDEDNFFAWIKRVTSVTDINGDRDELIIKVDIPRFNSTDLLELLAVFRRYRIDLRVLGRLETSENRSWFNDRSKWWHAYVFGDAKWNDPGQQSALS